MPISLRNSSAVLRGCFARDRVICCGAARRNNSAQVRATLDEFGYEPAGRAYIERVPGNPDATVVLIPCNDGDAPIDAEPVALIGLEDLRNWAETLACEQYAADFAASK